MKITRRKFIKGSACMGGTLLAPSLTGLNNAYASGNDYRALVCIFLFGGNDAYNMVIPTSSQEYDLYRSIRPKIAIPADQLVETGLKTDNGVSLGLHSAMTALKPVFQAGNATVMVNSGQLVEPVIGGRENPVLPEFLMAHNHQQTLWQSGSADLDERFGWAGRMVDSMLLSSHIAPVISFNGESKWLRADTLQQLTMTKDEPGHYSGLDTPERYEALQRHFTSQFSNLFESNYSVTSERRYHELEELKGYLDAIDDYQDFPDSSLGQTLGLVARMIRIRENLGHRKQVFFLGLGGFDTHKSQARQHESLLGQLAEAMAAFQSNMDQQKLSDQVTTFTMSDFGRRIIPNETGTDHGWGGHQLVMGGAVKGHKAHGRWPDLNPGSEYDYNNGRIIPEIAADQVNATLASWFGYPNSPETLFPSLTNGFSSKLLNFLPLPEGALNV